MKKLSIGWMLASLLVLLAAPAYSQITGISGARGSKTYYTISVPSGLTKLEVRTTGGSGDSDLYVKFGSRPTLSSYNGRSRGGNNAELVTINNPAAGTWYVMLYGYSAYSGLTLSATFTRAPAKTVVLIHGKTSSANTYWKNLPTYLTGDGYVVKQFVWNDDIGSLTTKAADLNTYINNTGASELDVVAHSLGVVVFRECVRSYSAVRGKIRKAVLISGPSYGVDLDVPGFADGISSTIRSEISPGSSFIWSLHNGGTILGSSKVLQILGGRNYLGVNGARTYGNADGLVAGISARLPSYELRIADYNHSKCAGVDSSAHQSYEFIKRFIVNGTSASSLPVYVTPNFKGGGLMAKCYDFNGNILNDPKIQIRKGSGTAYKEYYIWRNASGNSYASDQDWGQSSPTAQILNAGTYQARRVTYGVSYFLNNVTIIDGWMTVNPYLQ